MGGGLTSILGRLEFNWHLNYNGIRNPPQALQEPAAAIRLDCVGVNPIGLRAAVEVCGADRVMFGSDYGAVPYGNKEHLRIVEDVLPSPAERQQVFWKTSNTVLRLCLSDQNLRRIGSFPMNSLLDGRSLIGCAL
jgi:hypothetical protein